MAEGLSVPESRNICRLSLRYGQHHLIVPYDETLPPRRENQARMVALDPGVRSFLTWYCADSVGKIGEGAFFRIQRLCERLDDLLSRTAKSPSRRRRNMRRAANRMRIRIENLVTELHRQAPWFLVNNSDVIGQVPGRGVRVRHPDCTAQAAVDCVSGVPLQVCQQRNESASQKVLSPWSQVLVQGSVQVERTSSPQTSHQLVAPRLVRAAIQRSTAPMSRSREPHPAG